MKMCGFVGLPNSKRRRARLVEEGWLQSITLYVVLTRPHFTLKGLKERVLHMQSLVCKLVLKSGFAVLDT